MLAKLIEKSGSHQLKLLTSQDYQREFEMSKIFEFLTMTLYFKLELRKPTCYDKL